MNKLVFGRFAVVICVMWMLPSLGLAQGGCVDSPENPTMVLGLVGSAAAAGAYVRQRFTRKR